MTQAAQLAQYGASSVGLAFKNRIINGAMVIDQRNAGASGTASSYTVDRWAYPASQASKGTWQQNAGSVTPPVGFSNYLGFTSSSAYSVLTGDYFTFRQAIEGFNTADLGFGTANAKTVTLSFWVRSSLTGTFGVVLSSGNASRGYPATYTISSANTWEYKTITISGDTAGTWVGATNGTGMLVDFGLGVGSTYSATANTWGSGNILGVTGATSVVGTNGATFYITGVQLEVGSTATSFDTRSYTTELQLCQRYFCKNSNVDVVAANGDAYTDAGKFSSGTLNAYASGAAYADWIQYPVTMRSNATITFIRTNLGGSLNGAWTIYDAAGGTWESPTGQGVQSGTSTGFNVALTGNFSAAAQMYYGAWTASAEL